MSKSERSGEEIGLWRERLALKYRVGFFISLGAFAAGTVSQLRMHVERIEAVGLGLHIMGLFATILCGGWWWWFERRKGRTGRVDLEDAAAILSVSFVYNLGAAFLDDRTLTSYHLALVPGILLIVRAVVVPSTARRTLLIGALLASVSTTVFVVSGLPAWPVVQYVRPDWPPWLYGMVYMTWLATLVAIAAVTSKIVYQLRRDVKAARQLGQYVLAEKLGEGGMGVVYRATHALLRRETALKLLAPDRLGADDLRRFEREVVETARLRHPNTVAVYDYGRTPDGLFYYAMEYLDGLTLGELVAYEGPLPAGRVVWLLQQVCGSLCEAHAVGLVHRDVKPQNVMVVGHVAGYDHVKVLDFGLVKNLAPLEGAASLTRADHVTGTPLYMAPEAIARPGAAGPASDLYAVAAIGYYLLTGHHVFDGGSAVEIYAAHLHKQPERPGARLGKEVPADLEALILRGLAKTPAERPAGVAAFRDALLACAVPRWTEADAQAWWEAHGERARRREAPRTELEYATVTVARARAAAAG